MSLSHIPNPNQNAYQLSEGILMLNVVCSCTIRNIFFVGSLMIYCILKDLSHLICVAFVHLDCVVAIWKLKCLADQAKGHDCLLQLTRVSAIESIALTQTQN